MGKVWGTLGLLCGLFGIFFNIIIYFNVFSVVPIYLSLILGGVGVVFSIVGIAADDSKGPGVVGFIFSVIAVIGAIIWVV
jgi:hypothetical protein